MERRFLTGDRSEGVDEGGEVNREWALSRYDGTSDEGLIGLLG